MAYTIVNLKRVVVLQVALNSIQLDLILKHAEFTSKANKIHSTLKNNNRIR